MASVSGYLAWQFLRGRYLPAIEDALGRGLSAEERAAFADDAHGGLWETSLMLWLRPDLVANDYRDLPAARYSLARRLVPNYPLRGGGQGYVGHPALADPAFARATSAVLLAEGLELVNGLLDGTVKPDERRSPFWALPFLRTNFWPVVGAAVAAGVLAAWWGARRPEKGDA
jgi:hypothetical protein